jgi:hypothetical protein
MEYPYEKIAKIAERIGKMRDKKYKNDLKQIKKIIESSNPSIKDQMTKNNNGYFLPDFESYSSDTYIELTKYLDKIDQHEKSDNNDIKSDIYYSEKTDDRSESGIKKLKYTNSETHILNKIQYERDLKNHQNDNKNQNDEDDDEDKKCENKSSEKLSQLIKKKGSNTNKKLDNKENVGIIFKKQERVPQKIVNK